jgi:hypothetical protein
MGLFSIFLGPLTFEAEFSNAARVMAAKARRDTHRNGGLKPHLAIGSLHNLSLLFAAMWHKIAPHDDGLAPSEPCGDTP